MTIPYVGITDFTNFDQVKDMLKAFKLFCPPSLNRKRGLKRKLHVGVMMSYKTLHGIETPYSKVFPKNHEAREIFSSKETMNCLHYADYINRPDLAKSLTAAIRWVTPGINALQLDMTWPDPGEIIHGIHVSRILPEVILQIGTAAFEEANNDPREIVARLRDYDGVIHHVLLDKSMGKGLGMDAEGLIPFAQAIREHFPDLGIAAAGGLGPDTVRLVKPLLREFPDLSFDAQGKLRPSGNILDPIDWNLAKTYLMKSLYLLSDVRLESKH